MKKQHDYGPGDYETIPFRNDPADPRYIPTQEEWDEDDNVYSNCCGEPDRPIGIDGPSYSDLEICPKCRDHCDFE